MSRLVLSACLILVPALAAATQVRDRAAAAPPVLPASVIAGPSGAATLSPQISAPALETEAVQAAPLSHVSASAAASPEAAPPAEAWSDARRAAAAKIIVEDTQLPERVVRRILAAAQTNPSAPFYPENKDYPGADPLPRNGSWVLFDGRFFREGWYRLNLREDKSNFTPARLQRAFDSHTALEWSEAAGRFKEVSARDAILGRLEASGTTTLYRGASAAAAFLFRTVKDVKNGTAAAPGELLRLLKERAGSLDSLTSEFSNLAELYRSPERWPSLMKDAAARQELAREIFRHYYYRDRHYYSRGRRYPLANKPLFYTTAREHAERFGLDVPADFKKSLLRFDVDFRDPAAAPVHAGFETSVGIEQFRHSYPHRPYLEFGYSPEQYFDLADYFVEDESRPLR